MKQQTTKDDAAFERGIVDGNQQQTSTSSFPDLMSDLKAKLLAGQSFSLINLPEGRRAEAIGAIARLRDELPVRCRWATIRESHLSETRLRARTYSIPGEFLRGEVTR